MMSKTGKIMMGTTLVAVLVLMLLSAPAFAQVSIDGEECRDKCVDSVVYQRGTWDAKLKQCVYAIEEPCKYGCEESQHLNPDNVPVCKKYPDKPPENSTEYDKTLWEMTNELWNVNEKKATMSIHGTEYQAGDANGTMFLQLVENMMLPKNDASCVIDVYYPDKTYYLNGATMTYLNNSDGLYYKDIAIPNQLGVYMASAKCIYGIVYGQPEYVDNDIFVEGKEWNNDYTYTWSESTSYWKTREVDLLYDLQLNFSNVSLIGINPIELDIQFKVRNRCCQTWSGDTCTSGYSTPQEEFYIQIWNYSSSSWYQLPNVITDLVTSKQTVDNSLFQSSTNLLDLINNGEMILRVEEEGAGGCNESIDYNYIHIQFKGNQSEVIEELRGSGELHVTNFFQELNQSINDSFSEAFNYLQQINSTVHLNNDTLYDIWDFQLNELSNNMTEIQFYLADINDTTNNNYNWLVGMVNLSASEVWSYSNRTLTDYNQTEIINLLNNINTTLYNLTIGNISVSAYVNWTEGVVQMNNISNPTVVEAQVLTFAGANQDDVVTTTYQYCIDNMTLGYDINTTRCWLNNCYTINETTPVPCDYGCYNHQCNPEPFDRTMFLILIFIFIIGGLVVIALLYDRFAQR